MGRVGLVMTFWVAVAIVGWDEIKRLQRFPHPDRFIYVVVVWGILGILSELGLDSIAALFGVGFVIAMLYMYLGGLEEGEATMGTVPLLPHPQGTQPPVTT